MSKGTIKKVAGPLVIAKGMRDANMFDVVRVSDRLPALPPGRLWNPLASL